MQGAQGRHNKYLRGKLEELRHQGQTFTAEQGSVKFKLTVVTVWLIAVTIWLIFHSF